MDRVRSYYASFGEREWSRLERPDDGAIEFEITKRVLARHLKGRELVLDIGAGPGRYAIWLAQRGHRVCLADLSPALLDIARIKATEAGVSLDEITEADARDLSHWPDAAFTAVVSLGPFYHLQADADRNSAADEAARVLKPNGMLFAALMPRLAFLRRTLGIPDEQHRLLDEHWLERLLNSGRFDNDIPGRFDHGYGVRPEEVTTFFADRGFQQVELVAAEGVTAGLQAGVAAMSDPKLRDAAMDAIEKTASEPSILGLATHLLYVGRRTA